MKTLKNIALLALGLGLAINLSSCEKEEDIKDPPVNNDPLKEYTLIGEKDFPQGALSAKLYLKEDPFVGYNRIAVRVFQAGTDSKVEDAEVMFMPIMDMGAMMHTTPVENPDWDADMDAYMGAATFIMPSTAGDWLFNLIANQPGEVADTISFPISVEAKTEARLYSFVSADDSSTSYFVALKEPMQPKVGLNDFEVMIYRRESMMSFPDATDFQVEIEPTMPSMGHGSPDNINPVHVANGLYAGKVNFTMSGHWKVAVTLRNSTGALRDEDGFFNITL